MEPEVNSLRCLKPPFCPELQGLLNRPRMHLYLESLSEARGELSRFEMRFGDRNFLEVLADLWSKFTGLLGPPLAGQQPWEPLLLELLLRLVNGRPGETKICGGFRYGTAIGFQCPQRFVFELKQVLGIEKL